ncbi:MAG: hypothetical protein V3U94_02430 [Candidatus Thorarchaeota archaeon]
MKATRLYTRVYLSRIRERCPVCAEAPGCLELTEKDIQALMQAVQEKPRSVHGA